MLQFPDPTLSDYLQTDISDHAIGAVLYQRNEGAIKIIACGSRTLRGAELAYYTTEKELLALIWALQKYHSFLWGATIIHRTDHMALTFLRSCKLISKRLTRWIIAIQDYRIQMEHYPGKENIIADAISRQTTRTTSNDANREGSVVLNHMARKPNKSIKNNLLRLVESQENDIKLQAIRENITDKQNYQLREDCLYKKFQDVWKIYLPSSMLEELIINCHQIYGHLGARKCHLILSEDFYHPGFLKLIKRNLRVCHTCQLNKTPTQSSLSPSYPITLSRPLEATFIDYYGPLPTVKYGYKYILGVCLMVSANTLSYSHYVNKLHVQQ